jgi:hypothetical protein
MYNKGLSANDLQVSVKRWAEVDWSSFVPDEEWDVVQDAEVGMCIIIFCYNSL